MSTSPHDCHFISDHEDPDVASLELVSVRGTEGLSQLYRYELVLESQVDQGLPLAALEGMLGRSARITLGDVVVSGVLEEITLLATADATRTRYRATLVPRLSKLGYWERSRVFQTMSPVEVVHAVLDAHEVPYRDALALSYPVREYIVQYEESDLAFVTRLLEHWGIFFAFVQGEESATLILGDHNGALVPHEAYGALRFAPHSETAEVGWIGPIERRLRPTTAGLTTRDYNWRVPYLAEDGSQTARQLQLAATHEVDAITGRGHHRRYGDHFKDEAEGQHIAKVRAEQLMVSRLTHHGTLRAPGLAPGHRFETSGMPFAELEGEYILVETTLRFDRAQSSASATEFVAILADVPFRPAQRTPKPSVRGFMHAIVDGEVPGAAAPIDALGRYKVVMPYDEGAATGGHASRWIRMAQPSAGAGYGMHLPLHIGTEVAVLHLDGDPDRPVIAAALPNVDTASPVVDANATQSRIVTRTGIVFEMEDDA